MSGKVLHVNAGESLSLQYHEVKDETIFLFSGEMRFLAGASMETLEEVLPPRGGLPGTPGYHS